MFLSNHTIGIDSLEFLWKPREMVKGAAMDIPLGDRDSCVIKNKTAKTSVAHLKVSSGSHSRDYI